MSTFQPIDPLGTTPNDWCDRMTLELEQFGPVPRYMPELGWKDWARRVIQIPQIDASGPPNPDQFGDGDFVEWATYFIDAISVGV